MIKSIQHEGDEWFSCVCDNCGNVAENEEFNLMPDENSILELAMNQGWQHLENGVDYCTDCSTYQEEDYDL